VREALPRNPGIKGTGIPYASIWVEDQKAAYQMGG